MAAYSDEEILRRLRELSGGESIPPVTDTTRKVLLAKLQKLELGAQKRKSLLSFSSDESENEGKRNGNDFSPSAILNSSVNSNVRRTRRSLKGNSSVSLSLGISKDENDLPTFVQPRSPIRRSFTTAEITSREEKQSPSVPMNASKSRRSYAGKLNSKSKPVPLDLDTSGSDSDLSDSSISNIPENRSLHEFPKSRRSFNVSPTKAWTSTATKASKSATNFISYQSSDAAKLTSEPKTKQQHHLNGHHDVVDSANEFETNFSTDSPPNNSQCISMILVATLALFFLIVGLIYLGARHKDATPTPGREIAGTHDEQIIYDTALQLRNILRRIAGAAECHGRTLPSDRRMSYDEAERHVRTFKETLTTVDISDIFALYLMNRTWGIRLLDSSGTSIQKVHDMHLVTSLESIFVDVSFYCQLKRALQNTIYKVALGLAVMLALVALFSIIYWFWERKRREQHDVFALVERILEILQNYHRACRGNPSLQPYLAIPHVRDMLIPPSERKSKRGLWDAAVRFIQNNESRIRFEMQTVEGEDFLVWRWLQTETPNSTPGGSKTSRIWQGQAFENLDTGMNALPCSPTPCLKVRNMFDPDIEYEDNWPVHIRDAILEKCSNADIIHLRVDAASREGCVYIKCRDSETAGRVYKDLHGWWFDGKLVTVKYLRLERYHERFPDASGCSRPLLPSTQSPVSNALPVQQQQLPIGRRLTRSSMVAQ